MRIRGGLTRHRFGVVNSEVVIGYGAFVEDKVSQASRSRGPPKGGALGKDLFLVNPIAESVEDGCRTGIGESNGMGSFLGRSDEIKVILMDICDRVTFGRPLGQ